MFKLHKINPMVRAVGTMGAVMAVVGGVTFASLQSNTVALTDNTLVSATAHLQIGGTNGDSCAGASDGPQAGMSFSGLVPGVQSAAFPFCLSNTGDIPLNVTTGIPTVFTGTIPPSDVTLDMTCGDGGTSSGTLSAYTGGTPLGTLANGATTDCNAKVTLSPSYVGSGGSVTPFEIDFVGNQ
jgi:hypothetical protein